MIILIHLDVLKCLFFTALEARNLVLKVTRCLNSAPQGSCETSASLIGIRA